MKKSRLYLILFLVFVLSNCKEEDTAKVIYPYGNITSFDINGQVGGAVIDKTSRHVTVYLQHGTDLKNVVPVVGVSSNAKVSPASGEKVNFDAGNKKVNYVVESESGVKFGWTVEVVLEENPNAIKLELIPNTGGWEEEIKVYSDLSYNKYLTRSSGWNGGDGCISLLLPDGSVLWSFQDSFFGKVNSNRVRENNTFARNGGFLQKNQDLNSYVQLNPGVEEKTDTWIRYPGANENDDDTWYWGGPSQVVGNEVQMLLGQMVNGGFAGTHKSTDVVVFNMDMTFKELIQNKYIGSLSWDGSIFKADDGYTYMYTTENHGICGSNVYVARVSGHDLRNQWEYYTINGWVTTQPANHSDYASILDASATQCNVLKEDGKYYLVSQGTCFGLDINIYESDSPVGPFKNQRTLYRIPEKYTQDQSPAFITYNSVVHPHLSKEGELVISYNINPVKFEDNFSTPGSADNYRPYFVRVYNWK